MKQRAQLAVTVLLLGVILYVVISPIVDLPGTILRSHSADMHVSGLCVAITSVCLVPRYELQVGSNSQGLTSGELTSRISVLLC